jgi:hypothetical protein
MDALHFYLLLSDEVIHATPERQHGIHRETVIHPLRRAM